MKISGVYKIINKITGDCYIGSSIDLERRKRQHPTQEAKKYLKNDLN